jgi:hypothetical protein
MSFSSKITENNLHHVLGLGLVARQQTRRS